MKEDDKEKIAMGECVSQMTTERCPYCVDRCEASYNRINLSLLLKDLKIETPNDET